MARRLRMSAELGDWLAELCTSEPASAAEVGAAVTALMDAAEPASLAVLGAPAVDRIDPREELDYLYQGTLEAAQQVRREAADVATTRVGAERLLAALDSDPQADPAVQAWLRQARDKAKRAEAVVTKRSQRLQAEVDRFRMAKETAKAMYTAAEASLRIQDAMVTARYPHPPQPQPMGDEEPAELKRALEAAEAKLETVATEAYQTLRSVLDEAALQAGQLRAGPARPVAGLLELRADPLGRDVRLLLALEPADTVTLLAVLDGEDAIREHGSQAIRLAGDLLTDIRAGDWPLADANEPAETEVTFADSATFLARFFPSQASTIAARAAGLATARLVAQLRGSLSLAELSNNTGISEQRLRQIEDGGLRVAEVYEAVAYVRGLSGRLTLTAEVGESPPVQLA
jgi:phage shock protein A